MRKENAIQNYVIVILSIVVLVMSVGYALFTQPLNINGTAHVSPASWNVAFDTTVKNETGVTPTSSSVSGTTVAFEVNLAKPGDEYTLQTMVKNAGTIDAKLVRITLGGLTNNQKKFIEYAVTYDGTTYSTSTDNLNLALAANASKSVTVKIKYVTPSDPADLPDAAEAANAVNVTATLNYESVA